MASVLCVLCDSACNREPAAGHRREGHACLQLWIVRATGALEGVRPAPIEHIFTLGMRFQVEWHETANLAAALDYQVTRPPAGARGRGAGFLEGLEKFVARERMRIRR